MSDISAIDQFPFAKSRSGADILNREPENHFGWDDSDDRKQTAKSLSRKGAPSRNNLTKRLKPPDPLPADVEAALIVAAQEGDPNAAHCLFIHHEEWARVEARKRWSRVTSRRSNNERALTIDDFVATAMLAWWEAVTRWEPPYHLNTYSRKFIGGALSDIAHDWRNAPGLQIDSRLQRKIRGRPALWDRDNAEFITAVIELRKAFPNLSPSQLDRELNASAGIWAPDRYSEEACVDDDGEYDQEFGYKGGGESVFHGHLTGYEGGPSSEWSRGWGNGRFHRSRLIEVRSDWIAPGPKNAGGSIFVDRVTWETEERIAARMHDMGRNGFAHWLVRRESTYRLYDRHDVPAPYAPTAEAAMYRDSPQAARHGFWHLQRSHGAPLFGPGQAAMSCWDLSSPSKTMVRIGSLNFASDADFLSQFAEPISAPVLGLVQMANDKYGHRIRGIWRARVILYLDRNGVGHFNSMVRDCGLPNQAAAARVLRRLEREGYVLRTLHAVGPPVRTDWRLTDHGRSIVPIAEALIEQARDHADEVRRRKGIHPIEGTINTVKAAA